MVKPEKGDGQKAQRKNVLMLYKHGSENGSINILIKKQEELEEKQKEERLERGGTTNYGGGEQKNHIEEQNT